MVQILFWGDYIDGNFVDFAGQAMFVCLTFDLSTDTVILMMKKYEWLCGNEDG